MKWLLVVRMSITFKIIFIKTKLSFMLKYISTAVFSILLFVVIIFTVINYHNNNVLESRINTISKYDKEIKSEKSFKEDYYILQQSHDTNLILVMFGLMVAITGFFTYQNIVANFELKSSELKNEINELKDKTINEIGELKKKTTEEIGIIHINYMIDISTLTMDMADKYLQQENIEDYIYYTIWGISKLADGCLWGNENSDDDDEVRLSIESIIKNIPINLKSLNDKINSHIALSEFTLNQIVFYIDDIRRLQNHEIDKFLNEIQSKLKKK